MPKARKVARLGEDGDSIIQIDMSASLYMACRSLRVKDVIWYKADLTSSSRSMGQVLISGLQIKCNFILQSSHQYWHNMLEVPTNLSGRVGARR